MQRMFSLKEKLHGSEDPILFRWQRSLGNYLATSGADHSVKIWDRHGHLEAEMHLSGACIGLEWDAEGDSLCAVCDKISTLFLWDANQKKSIRVDSGSKELITFLSWSKSDFILALGTAKGNLILYNRKVGRKIPVLGKHNRKIICGCWSQNKTLALGGADNVLTVSNDSGKTLHQTNLRDTPSLVQFSEMKGPAKSGENTVTNDRTERWLPRTRLHRKKRNTYDSANQVRASMADIQKKTNCFMPTKAVSLVVGKKTLFLFKLFDPDNVIELAFQSSYGKIESYLWYGDGYVMIGFSHGYFVVISTHQKEIGQELFQVRNYHDYLSSVAISHSLNYAASCGDTSVRIHDLRQLQEITAIIELNDEPKGLKDIMWTDDGQLLAISTLRGGLHCYLTKLNLLGDTFGTKIAYLKSLQEVTIVNSVEGQAPMTIAVNVEPTFIACGAFHVAVGMNNRAWFHFMTSKDSHKVRDREYLGSIEKMSLNADYAAVLFEGKVQLHMIDQGVDDTIEEREAKLFPDRDGIGKITCSTLTNDFFIYATETGTIHFFFIEDWSQVNTYRHSEGIRDIFPDSAGCHLAFIDDKGEGFIYNPVDDGVYPIPSFPSHSINLLWDTNPYDKGVFLVHDKETIYTYIFCRETLRGPEVHLVGESHLPFSQKPLLLYNGTLTLHITSGKTSAIQLSSHNFLQLTERNMLSSADQKSLDKAITLRKWRDAWMLCTALNNRESWLQLGAAALHAIDVDLAIRVYRFLQDAGMVLALEEIRDVEDNKLLAGILASYVGEFDLAQDLLLTSSQPNKALDMRRDLMHWDTALKLATRLDPNQIPFISKEYGQQLEFTGDYSSALLHFEQGLTRDPQRREHDELCAAGMARTAIRVGDIRRGINIALAHPNRSLKKECGVILEGMRQFSESASMFEKGGYFEKAAAVYVRNKNWTKIGEMLPKINSPKIHLQYAKAKEMDGKYHDAAKAYYSGKDFDSAVRILLDHLRDPEKAVKIVKESGSIEGAKLVSKFFVKLGDFGSAIEFLVLSKCNDEAFQMAQQHGQMETYAQVIGDDATPEDFNSIAVHFDNEKNHFMAGRFFLLSGNYTQAMKHFLRCSSDETKQAIEMAIQTISRANDDKLTRQLIDFLMGETDGIPKDPNYLFKLYVALKRYPEAARTAIIISKEEQNNGNYRHARDLLFSMTRELQKREIKVPAEMENNLLILHSYLLAKAQLKRGDHLKAARLLIRVSENISKFPEHIVALLTSTVIECHKANLKHSSFSYASMLMRPEYRGSIDGKYKKKIELIVRKSGKAEEEDEATSPCPYCDFDLTESELICPNCRNNIPYCIATGRHITRSNLTSCPNCEFPALMSDFERFLSHEPVCPMCSEKVDPGDLRRVKNLEKYLGNE